MTRKPKSTQPNARERLSKSFLEALGADFQAHGADVIGKMRETHPERYAELAGKLIMTIEQPPDGFENANTMQDLAVQLLKMAGCDEGSITDTMVEQATKAYDSFVAKLEAIRDAAQGSMQ